MSRRGQRRRRAAVKNSGWVTQLYHQVCLPWWGRACAYCGSVERLTMDHVTPISAGGRHRLWNLVPACDTCNQAKASRHPMDWLQSIDRVWMIDTILVWEERAKEAEYERQQVRDTGPTPEQLHDQRQRQRRKKRRKPRRR